MHRESTLGIDNSFPNFFFLKTKLSRPISRKRKITYLIKFINHLKKLKQTLLGPKTQQKHNSKPERKEKKLHQSSKLSP